MTPHDHTKFVPGCFRCELSRDEVEDTDTELDMPLLWEGSRSPRIAFVRSFAHKLRHPAHLGQPQCKGIVLRHGEQMRCQRHALPGRTLCRRCAHV